MVAGRPITEFSEAAFWSRFGRLEHERLEFKASANNLREVIPAMAMTAGGQVVLGVSDDRRLVGCRLDQPTLDAIMRRAQECAVEVSVQPLLVAAVPLILVTVPAVQTRIVTTSDGRLLRRIGSDNVPLRGDQLTAFLRRRGRAAQRLRSVLPRLSRDSLGVLSGP
jgi:predicted HTH transcriptional regulator